MTLRKNLSWLKFLGYCTGSYQKILAINPKFSDEERMLKLRVAMQFENRTDEDDDDDGISLMTNRTGFF